MLMKLRLECLQQNYLRVDSSEDENLISTLIQSAEKMCLAIARKNEEEIIKENFEEYKVAVLYGISL